MKQPNRSARRPNYSQSQRRRDTRHDPRDHRVQFLIRRVGLFHDLLSDVVESFVLCYEQRLSAHSTRTPTFRSLSVSLLTSRHTVTSEFSTRLCVERIQLYGSTTTSDTFGDGKIE